MADAGSSRGDRLAPLLLVAAAGGLWGASRLPWVTVRLFDGLGQPRQSTVSGADWSTALLPLAVLCLAAAVAVIPRTAETTETALRGWVRRLLAVLMAAASAAAGYLAIGMWAINDVAARAAAIAGVPLASLVGSQRRYAGASITLTAAVCMLAAAVLLMRRASSAARPSPGPARAARGSTTPAGASPPQMSERMIWDALDEGSDPTDQAGGPKVEGR